MEQKAVGALLEEEQARLDHMSMRQQIVSAASASVNVGSIGRGAGSETHRLWADGSNDSTFKNNHGCWDLFKAVN